jgi:LEA14-like dessication related protein
LGRSFRHVLATRWNRESFVTKLRIAIGNTEPLTVHDIHQFAEIICQDIPLDFFETIAAIIQYDSTRNAEEIVLDIALDNTRFVSYFRNYLFKYGYND